MLHGSTREVMLNRRRSPSRRRACTRGVRGAPLSVTLLSTSTTAPVKGACIRSRSAADTRRQNAHRSVDRSGLSLLGCAAATFGGGWHKGAPWWRLATCERPRCSTATGEGEHMAGRTPSGEPGARVWIRGGAERRRAYACSDGAWDARWMAAWWRPGTRRRRCATRTADGGKQVLRCDAW